MKRNSDNKVFLQFPKLISFLADYDYGVDVFSDQAKGFLDYSKPFVVVFPDQIVYVAPSFVQGFFKDVVEKIGMNKTLERLTIESRSERLSNTIREKLYDME